MSRPFPLAHRAFLRLAFLAAVFVFASVADGGPVVPSFSAGNFTAGAAIDNIYFPLVPGRVVREGAIVTDPDSGETGFQRDEDFVTFKTKLIAGVHARVVRSRSWVNNVLIEDTFDYYAQDKSGNVWYLGEDTKAFEYDDHGKIVNVDTSGSFHAGVNGAKPGFIMPANPAIGFSYYQEFAPNDDALDQAEIVALNESVTVPFGSFTHVLKTRESSALEPGVFENKFYAPHVGEVMVLEDIQPNGQPLNTFTLRTVAVIPLPEALWPGLTMLGVLLVIRETRRLVRIR